MKNFLLKSLVIGLFLLAMPMKQYGQQPRYAQNESTIDFDITEIDLFEERIVFLYNLINDSRFDVVNSEQDGVFVISADPAYPNLDLQEAFNEFKNDQALAFSAMNKENAAEVAMSYKALLPKQFALSLMMDVYAKSRQNNHCNTADPFCTDVGVYQFPAGVSSGSGESGPDYNCLHSTPNPAWYYMKIANPGGMNITMYSTPTKDIDFCCWGPFDDPVTPCPTGLTGAKVVSCSYSTSSTENCVIPNNAQTGNYYILIITNYSNQACNITFSKTSGNGTTDCSIMPPLVENGGPYCLGETITLTGNAQSGATYSWSGPGGWSATGSTVTRPNCTMAMAGTYTCTISLNGQTSSTDTQVEVYANPTANFNFTTVCQGSPTQFNSTSTTNPSGQTITNYQWDFGDGLTGSGQSVNHTYAQPGTYQVTLVVHTGDHTCSDDITKAVTVYAMPTANFDAPTVCEGSPTQFTSSTTGATAYNWNFGDGQTGTGQTVNHTYAQPGTYNATLTVETGNGTCSDDITKTVTVNAMPAANFTATSVCFGDDTQFTNSSHNSIGSAMNYLWNFGDGATSTDAHPVHHYEAPGNYNVRLTASCGDCSHFIEHNVQVHAVPVASASAAAQSVTYGDHTTLSGSSGVSGNFNYHWEPANMVVNPNAQSTNTIGLTALTNTFTLTVTNAENNDCVSTAQVTVLVEGSSLNAYANATPDRICLSDTTQLHAITIGGAPNLTYLWEPSSSLVSAPNVAEPLANPTTSTTYHCTISDGLTTITVSVDVMVDFPEYEEETQYICPDGNYLFYGQSYSAEGDYEHITTTAQGCEKIITLHLHHYPSYSNAHTTTEFICPGESYLFHGANYSETGSYPVNLHTTQGCDSIVWLNLTVRPANDTIVENKDICLSDTLIWHGNAYYNDGDEAYFEDVDNNGCLLVRKLHLRVGEYQSPPDSYDPNVYQCVPYDEEPYYYWPIAHREYYADTRDTIVIPNPDPKKCDTLYTLNLKFHKESFITDTVVACDSYPWDITNQIYTSTNHHISYTYNIPFGPFETCDSTFVLDLTVNHSADTIFNVQSCNEYTWHFGNNNETYSFTESQHNLTKIIQTVHGCDSIGTLNLEIDYSPTFNRIEGRTWVIGGSEFQYTIEDYHIETQGSHNTTWELTYLDGSPFNKWDLTQYGASNDHCLVSIYTFELDTILLTATTTSVGSGSTICGNEPFSRSKQIICSSYSTPETLLPCIVDIYPNPNDGNMNLSFTNMSGEIIVKVFNMQGTLIDQFKVYNGYDSNAFTYSSDRLSTGIYLFSIASKEGTLTKKVVITK
jgi:PKD repeat protein